MTVLPLPDNDAVETVLKKDRAVILTALCAMFVASWAYLMSGAGMGHSPIDMTVMFSKFAAVLMKPVVWTPLTAVSVAFMWLVLTIAIVIPAAAPIVLLHAIENRKRREPVNVSVFCGLLLSGYLTVWGLFSLAAAAAQWTLEQAALITQALSVADARIAGGLFIAAGLYQFAGVKQASLKHIRHPDKYIFNEWKDGAVGALQMGVKLGSTLLGSCWLLVALLFAGGMLNVLWIAGLAGYIMLEKLSGHGRVVSIMFGCALTCWGIFVVVMAIQP